LKNKKHIKNAIYKKTFKIIIKKEEKNKEQTGKKKKKNEMKGKGEILKKPKLCFLLSKKNENKRKRKKLFLERKDF